MQSYQYERTTTIIALFNLLFLMKYKKLLIHEGRGSGYNPEIHFFLSRYQPLTVIFHRNHKGGPINKKKKIKRSAKKPSKKRLYHYLAICFARLRDQRQTSFMTKNSQLILRRLTAVHLFPDFRSRFPVRLNQF